MVKLTLNLERVKQLMEQSGYTIETLAQKIGVTADVTRKYLKGAEDAKVTFCVGLAQALNTTLDDIVRK